MAVAADMIAPVDDGDRFLQHSSYALGKGGTPEACADDEVLHSAYSKMEMYSIFTYQQFLSIYQPITDNFSYF